MITETQIIEAAKECGGRYDWTDNIYDCTLSPIQLHRFAQHFHRQGLLDAAEKVETTGDYNTGNGKPHYFLSHEARREQGKAIRQMAEEIK
jgi:hypothetical protein